MNKPKLYFLMLVVIFAANQQIAKAQADTTSQKKVVISMSPDVGLNNASEQIFNSNAPSRFFLKIVQYLDFSTNDTYTKGALAIKKDSLNYEASVGDSKILFFSDGKWQWRGKDMGTKNLGLQMTEEVKMVIYTSASLALEKGIKATGSFEGHQVRVTSSNSQQLLLEFDLMNTYYQSTSKIKIDLKDDVLAHDNEFYGNILRAIESITK